MRRRSTSFSDLLEDLSPDQRKVICLRFGFDPPGSRPFSYTEIARSLALSSIRVKELEKKALRKMKKRLETENLKLVNPLHRHIVLSSNTELVRELLAFLPSNLRKRLHEDFSVRKKFQI